MDNILKVKNVHDYNSFVGHADQHPLVSVIDYATVSPILHTRSKFSVYALFLRDDILEDLSYGCSKYDYHEGTLICVAPGQIGGGEKKGANTTVRNFKSKVGLCCFIPIYCTGLRLTNELKITTVSSPIGSTKLCT